MCLVTYLAADAWCSRIKSHCSVGNIFLLYDRQQVMCYITFFKIKKVHCVDLTLAHTHGLFYNRPMVF